MNSADFRRSARRLTDWIHTHRDHGLITVIHPDTKPAAVQSAAADVTRAIRDASAKSGLAVIVVPFAKASPPPIT